MKTFDELFDGFFGKNRKSKKNNTENPDEPANEPVADIVAPVFKVKIICV